MLFLPLFHTLCCCCFDSSSFTLKHLYIYFFYKGFQEVWLRVVFWEWDWVRKLLFFFVCNRSPCPTYAKIVGYLLGTLSKVSGKLSFEICWAVVLHKSTFWPPVHFLPLTVTEVYPCNKYILHINTDTPNILASSKWGSCRPSLTSIKRNWFSLVIQSHLSE